MTLVPCGERLVRAGPRPWLIVFAILVMVLPVAHPASEGEPAVFVVDSANALYSFDVGGNALQRMQFNPDLGQLNGGITLAMGKVYLTWVKPSGQWGGVFAYDGVTLKQVRLHVGAFAANDPDPGMIHGIVWDSGNQRFFVATEHLGLLAFDRAGALLPRTSGTTVPTLAVAYDSAGHSRWAIDAHNQLAQLSEDDAQLPGFRIRGPGHSRAAGMAYCAGGDGVEPAIAVAFKAAKAESPAAGAIRAFDPAGKPLRSFHGPAITDPHGLSCSSRGELFVAAGNGLLEYNLQGSALSPPGDLHRLSAPLYGVLAAY
jgi:hypothetical protein